MFDFAKAAPTFNDHIKGQLFWHGDFLRHFLPEIASVYMEKDSIVYDFGASTGNVEVALKEKIEERNIPEHLASDYTYHVTLKKSLEGVINYYGGYD